jgi:hypothetical protein
MRIIYLLAYMGVYSSIVIAEGMSIPPDALGEACGPQCHAHPLAQVHINCACMHPELAMAPSFTAAFCCDCVLLSTATAVLV